MADSSLTFLFTDLDSSTRLWEQFPQAMGAALERHDHILRRSVEEVGGKVVKTTGDGLMAVFDSPDAGIAACMAAQLGLDAEPWEATGPLRVRMGLHVGEAEPREGDFYGPAVNRAARIMAAAHGGQVLLSGLAASLVAGNLPTGSSLFDLGRHRLKDLAEPEHLFQLDLPGLPIVFPPLATLTERPNNLPSQASAMLGRKAEIKELTSLMAGQQSRLMTLVGSGGTGKTRLALQAAAECIEAFEDGAFFVDLSEARTADGAFETVQRTLGLSGASGTTPLDSLVQLLDKRQILIILDNLEQVTEMASGVVDLLERLPELSLMATSREPLRVRGERIYQVPPLALPDRAHLDEAAEADAVRLFTERAKAVLPSFALDETNLDAVVDICARLDGLPLAIELAAARLRILSPHQLRDRLENRLDVLGGGARDLPARQQTLAATVAWSYELLDPEEQALFRVLSVFPSATLDSVEAVASDLGRWEPLALLDLITSLVDKSLVRSVDDGTTRRLSMLRTIREHAAELLNADPDMAASARMAHADYFSQLAVSTSERLHSDLGAESLDQLETEIDNLLTAWGHWVTLGRLERLYELLDGLWALHEARGWYHGAIRLTEDLLGVLVTAEPTPERAREEIALRTSLARAIMAVRGYTEEVEEAYNRVLHLSARHGDVRSRAPVLRSLASLYLQRAEFDKALKTGQELMELAESEDDDSLRVQALQVVGSQTAFLGNLPAGLAHLDRAIELFDPSRHRFERFGLGPSPGVLPYTTSAILLWWAGHPQQAVDRMTAGIEMARRLDHPISLAYGLFHAGFLAVSRQDVAAAQGHADELLEIARTHDYRIWTALGLVLRGVATTALGDPISGLDDIGRGIALYRRLQTPPVFWGPLLSLRALANGLAGRVREGIALIDEAIALTSGEDTDFAMFAVIKADLLEADHRPDEAEALLERALEVAVPAGFRMTALLAATRLTRLRRTLHRETDGRDRLRDIYDTFTEGLDMPDLVDARTVLEGE